MVREILKEGKFRRFICQNGWEFLERVCCGGIVAMIAVTDDQNLILVEQYRTPVGKNVIEFPAGLANDQHDNQHESLEDTARRELVEETGYEAKELVFITQTPANSSSSSDILTVYHAKGLKKVGQGGGDETENIIVHAVPMAQINDWLRNQEQLGKLVDVKIYAGLYYLKHLS